MSDTSPNWLTKPTSTTFTHRNAIGTSYPSGTVYQPVYQFPSYPTINNPGALTPGINYSMTLGTSYSVPAVIPTIPAPVNSEALISRLTQEKLELERMIDALSKKLTETMKDRDVLKGLCEILKGNKQNPKSAGKEFPSRALKFSSNAQNIGLITNHN